MGQTVNKTGTLYNPFTYRGYYQDDEAGLYYLINRYYDPQDGRFLSQDTIEPLSANLYSYTSDDPVNFTDPNGEKYGSHNVEEFTNLGQALLDMYLSYTNRNTKTLWDIKKNARDKKSYNFHGQKVMLYQDNTKKVIGGLKIQLTTLGLHIKCMKRAGTLSLGC
ncbi:RHS repeat-associated core domain-containing protein [Aneurinibacillus sp. Ricciae_BoGa-3]|uniref:RHS repeat-associated core domain-containing protein n=1 Tax=Aneurinibacillus sp. Ricciae_BoGa-3 TaxID=3022697 RepID=UPI0023401F45|nr:RHS repeat-associated core domain-containing protein [Aneurinibacillus sp. Ricciae_BoGa-3]WCK54084.1 RHS repeat-associated core domain-containing protein [Aneurinibacillus sp. Ricciae_BoGa-3]